MHSLMILHRSFMQKENDSGFECNRGGLSAEARNRRKREREDLLDFLTTRGLDRAARKERRPQLRLVENCGSQLRRFGSNSQ